MEQSVFSEDYAKRPILTSSVDAFLHYSTGC